jgi:virulence-associated protein VagC
MPDGAQFEMQWKQVKYMNGGHSAVFEIVPMYQGKDIIIFPTAQLWTEAQNVFSDQERLEIIFLLERIAWKRDIRVLEANVEPDVDINISPVSGSIESTPGYQEMAAKNLFDPQCSLSKSEVKEIYCILEKRFAEGASGMVTIPKNVILQGSVLEKVSIPALKANKNVVLISI